MCVWACVSEHAQWLLAMRLQCIFFRMLTFHATRWAKFYNDSDNPWLVNPCLPRYIAQVRDKSGFFAHCFRINSRLRNIPAEGRVTPDSKVAFRYGSVNAPVIATHCLSRDYSSKVDGHADYCQPGKQISLWAYTLMNNYSRWLGCVLECLEQANEALFMVVANHQLAADFQHRNTSAAQGCFEPAGWNVSR